MLIGTDEGLTLLDLNPLLSSTAPLRTSAQPSLSDASIHPLWTGLGVLQLEVILERSTLSISAAGGAPVGLVIGLVKPEGGGEVELRMWSLAALSNLARWKVFNESSPPLDLSSPSSASNASPTTSIEGKRSSRSYIKSLFSSSPTSPVDTKGKGKARAFPSASAAIPTPLRETTDEEEGFVVLGDSAQDSRGHSRIRSSISDTSTTAAAPTTADSETRFFVPPSSHPVARLSSESLRPSSISSSLGRTTPTPTSPSNTNANLSLPLSWANSSIRFPLPKNATPILFFTLCRTPPPSPPSTPAHPRREAGIRERRSRAEKERQEEERREAGRVWLLVATSRTVYVYESGEGGQRRWRLRREFYAPATPKLLTLIRALPPHGPNSPPPLGLTRRDSARKSKRSTSPPPSSSTTSSSTDLPPDLTLYLTMRSKSVLINLVDSSVREVSLPPSSAPGHGRSGSTLQAASSLTARAVEVGKRKVEKMVEGRQGVPVGMRGEGGMGLVKGRKVGDGAGAGAVVGGGEEGGGGDWVGCQRLSMLLPGGGGGGRKEAEGERSRRRTDLLLLTKGSTTSIYPSPLPSFTPSLSATSSSSSTPLLPPSTLPTPLASFSFPLTSSSPLLGLTPLVRRDLKPSYAERGMQHLVLTAWTRSGVHVKEGVVDPFALGAGGGGRWFTPLDEFEKKVGESVLLSPSPSQPTTTTTERDGAPNDDDDDEELEGQASLDFGREILQLGVGGSVLHLPPPSSSRPALGDSEDSDDDEESEFGDGAARRAREEEEEEEVRRETEGGVFFCVRGVEDWGLKWVG
ncbi:hypothetical protein BCR35DRAFT_351734 [Leucosporidium creatinivorum]|uniref:Uncharacterized protein n=1 Tax=Leucosporidium creatinivorum TaxID=106004 RepID=A0A1Y2FQ14_9BASI|nr:hypothetical protein BCR35DRAFT_351734 [Leucosporidium creatinivorum]